MRIFSAPQVRFRDDMAGREILFTKPLAILAPTSPEAFTAALAEVERARADGYWIAGYLSYEAGYLLEAKLKNLLPATRRAPLACLGIFDAPQCVSAAQADLGGSNDAVYAPRRAWSFSEYAERFERLHGHLRRGDCYQGNLTFPVFAAWRGDPERIFDSLIERQPVRYGALVSLGEPVVLSRSPELFFEVDDEGNIETLPMKGTAPRGDTPDEDERQRAFLRNDPKNQAENRMIVDLLRNDISRISVVGTLEAPEMFRIETYPTVHQMVSRIRARLLPDLPLGAILAALFPCGSITGAPKIRAMELLRALEDGPRGVYCGAIGWLAPDGRMRFNVAIRTLSLFGDGEAVFNVGGGVVFDSTAQAEYEECLLKARFATGEIPA
jgi:para-aminobenzoate synthetase component I